MTMRRDAIYPSIVVGQAAAGRRWLGKAPSGSSSGDPATVPEIVDYDLPVAGASTTAASFRSAKVVSGPRAEGDARDLGPREC
jgi:3-polyprenyl-4-hydroxybenzoate decarboxylase and related decarboxylases